MQKAEHLDGNKVIADLQKGHMSVLDDVYDRYRDEYLRWASGRVQDIGRSQLLDAWHDTMLMFYEQVRDRKTKELTCELKSFLFKIAERRLFRLINKTERVDFVEAFDANISLNGSINTIEQDTSELDEETVLLLQLAVNELPEQSRKILVLRYMEGKSIPEIMELMHYTSVNAVSVTLSRALVRLKESIIEKREKSKQWKGEMKR